MKEIAEPLANAEETVENIDGGRREGIEQQNNNIAGLETIEGGPQENLFVEEEEGEDEDGWEDEEDEELGWEDEEEEDGSESLGDYDSDEDFQDGFYLECIDSIFENRSSEEVERHAKLLRVFLDKLQKPYCNLRFPFGQAFGRILEAHNNKKIVCVDFSDTQLTDSENVSLLISFILNNPIRILKLASNGITPLAQREIINALIGHSTLQFLQFGEPGNNDDDLLPLLATLLKKTPSLNNLDLNHFSLSRPFDPTFTETIIKSRTLKKFTIFDSRLSIGAVKSIVEIIQKNLSIEYLDLGQNQFYSLPTQSENGINNQTTPVPLIDQNRLPRFLGGLKYFLEGLKLNSTVSYFFLDAPVQNPRGRPDLRPIDLADYKDYFAALKEVLNLHNTIVWHNDHVRFGLTYGNQFQELGQNFIYTQKRDALARDFVHISRKVHLLAGLLSPDLIAYLLVDLLLESVNLKLGQTLLGKIFLDKRKLLDLESGSLGSRMSFSSANLVRLCHYWILDHSTNK